MWGFLLVAIVVVIIVIKRKRDNAHDEEIKASREALFELTRPKRTNAILNYFNELGIVPLADGDASLKVDSRCLRLLDSVGFANVMDQQGDHEKESYKRIVCEMLDSNSLVFKDIEAENNFTSIVESWAALDQCNNCMQYVNCTVKDDNKGNCPAFKIVPKRFRSGETY